MKIISQFKDYYDNILIHGIDPNIKYIRTETYYDAVNNSKDIPENVTDVSKTIINLLCSTNCKIACKNFTITAVPGIIGFCGKLYVYVNLNNKIFFDVKKLHDNITKEDCEKLEVSIDEFKSALNGEYKKVKSGYRYMNNYLTINTWNNKIEEISRKQYDELFIKLKSPVFHVWSVTDPHPHFTTFFMEINPNLGKLNFQKIKPPVECFQEISMYIGNQLSEEKSPMINIPDNIMRDEKGFNEWSFRRHKEENKKLTTNKDK